MQAIVHKVAVEPLEVPLRAIGITLCDPVELAEEPCGRLAVFIRRRRWNLLQLFSRRARYKRLGFLGAKTAESLAPALRKGLALRIRVVDLIPAHLNPAGTDALHLSIWCDKQQLVRAQGLRPDPWRALPT